MKKNIVLLLAICSLTACIKEKDLSGDREKNYETIISNCEPFKDYQVPIKEGMTTIIMNGNDTLAVANEPITIKIPKTSSLVTKSGDNQFTIQYVDNAVMKTRDTYYKYWQAVMFEDSKEGDYDFNDLIIHIANKVEKPHGSENWYQIIDIQPIALGSNKTIELGCILFDQSEHIISSNVRKDLFLGKPGFINTENESAPIRYKLSNVINKHSLAAGTDTRWIAWFIEVKGEEERFYAISADYQIQTYDKMFNTKGMPYGIVVGNDNGTFNYPKERTSLYTTYPGFKSWLEAKSDKIGSSDKQYVYQYCTHHSIGDTARIWDYEDLK